MVGLWAQRVHGTIIEGIPLLSAGMIGRMFELIGLTVGLAAQCEHLVEKRARLSINHLEWVWKPLTNSCCGSGGAGAVESSCLDLDIRQRTATQFTNWLRSPAAQTCPHGLRRS